MKAEVYVSRCCGAMFVPGFGPDNIVENDGPEFFDAKRDGICPVCTTMRPDMMQVFPDGSDTSPTDTPETGDDDNDDKNPFQL